MNTLIVIEKTAIRQDAVGRYLSIVLLVLKKVSLTPNTPKNGSITKNGIV